MRITILCPSPLLKDSAIQSLADDYIKRMNHTVQIIEVATKISNNDTADLVKKKQGESLLKHLDKLGTDTQIITLDERGKNLSSPELAKKLTVAMRDGTSSFCFVIGGAYGLSSDILAKAHFSISFGKMVWPHRLVGVMLLEQLYRAQQINVGHPYHKD